MAMSGGGGSGNVTFVPLLVSVEELKEVLPKAGESTSPGPENNFV